MVDRPSIPRARGSTPIKIAILNDFEIIVAGLATLLEPYQDRVVLVPLDATRQMLPNADIVLVDTFGQRQGDRFDLDQLVRTTSARVVIFSWHVDDDLVELTIARGASGYLSKGLPVARLVELIEQVHAGQIVAPGLPTPLDSVEHASTWPGREHGLSSRESEVISLIAQGYSNQEIADHAFLSINSVKTYIRTAYRKLRVTRRSQAVIWAVDNGLLPDHQAHQKPPGSR